jgi:hypothetical protein
LGQGPLIEFSVKSQQGEFFIRKAYTETSVYQFGLNLGCSSVTESEIPFRQARLPFN